MLSIVEISLPTNFISYRIDACEPRSSTSHPLETSFFFLFEQTHISLIIKGSTESTSKYYRRRINLNKITSK